MSLYTAHCDQNEGRVILPPQLSVKSGNQQSAQTMQLLSEGGPSISCALGVCWDSFLEIKPK